MSKSCKSPGPVHMLCLPHAAAQQRGHLWRRAVHDLSWWMYALHRSARTCSAASSALRAVQADELRRELGEVKASLKEAETELEDLEEELHQAQTALRELQGEQEEKQQR